MRQATKTIWDKRGNRSLKRKIDAGINRTLKDWGPATKSPLVRTLRDSTHPSLVDAACFYKGVTLKTASADDVFDILYGITWADRNGRPLSEYFATPWGVDLGDAAEDEPRLAFG